MEPASVFQLYCGCINLKGSKSVLFDYLLFFTSDISRNLSRKPLVLEKYYKVVIYNHRHTTRNDWSTNGNVTLEKYFNGSLCR